MREHLEVDFNPSFGVIRTELDQVQQYISKCIKFSEFPIESHMEFLLQGTDHFPGPALVILSGKATEGFRTEHIAVAAMIEMIYRSSLLHNQVDSAGTTENHADSARLESNAAHILLGDFLLSQVFAVQFRLQMEGVGDVLSRTALTLITGGLRRKLAEARWEMEESEYIDMAAMQNPALFRSGCRLGAMVSGAADDHVKAFSEYGYQLGMAYQFKDDLRTVLQAEKHIGDDVTAEALLNKKVLPVIHCFNQSGRGEIDKKMSLESFFSRMHQTNSINYTRKRIQHHADEAGRLLSPFSSCPYIKCLLSLADTIRQSVVTEDI